METWEDLSFWRSGEWQWAQEVFDEYDRLGTLYNPPRHRLFASMDATPYRNVRVAIIGQDPYPNRADATGIAFSIPEDESNYPPTLCNIFDELCADLHVDYPEHGNLIPWTAQGVFLWNTYASCETGVPGSHRWLEWELLTQEIVEKLQDKPIDCFVFMGSVAHKFAKYVTKTSWNNGVLDNIPCNNIIYTSHPSPLGVDKGREPFKGSRLFSRINSYLVQPIDWRLCDAPCSRSAIEQIPTQTTTAKVTKTAALLAKEGVWPYASQLVVKPPQSEEAKEAGEIGGQPT